jgi:hypothetical protein
MMQIKRFISTLHFHGTIWGSGTRFELGRKGRFLFLLRSRSKKLAREHFGTKTTAIV